MRHKNRVHENAFGIHRMSGNPAYGHDGFGGIKGLVNNLSEFSAVDGVSKVNRKFRSIEFL